MWSESSVDAVASSARPCPFPRLLKPPLARSNRPPNAAAAAVVAAGGDAGAANRPCQSCPLLSKKEQTIHQLRVEEARVNQQSTVEIDSLAYAVHKQRGKGCAQEIDPNLSPISI